LASAPELQKKTCPPPPEQAVEAWRRRDAVFGAEQVGDVDEGAGLLGDGSATSGWAWPRPGDGEAADRKSR
jgi:hypothetical protein